MARFGKHVRPTSRAGFAVGLTAAIFGALALMGGLGYASIGRSSASAAQYEYTPTPLNPGTTTCNGVYNGTGTNVIVPGGAVCTLAAGTTVTHDVNVESGGTLIDLGVAIGHDIDANGADGIQVAGGTVGHDLTINGLNGSPPTGDNFVCSTTVSHDLVVTNGTAAGGSIDIGDPPDCSTGNNVGHDLNVQGNANHVDVSENGTSGTPIGHDLIVKNNHPGGAGVIHNYAGHNATCAGNLPQTGSANHAAGTNTCPV